MLRALQVDHSRDHPQTVQHHPVNKRISSGRSPSSSRCHLMTEKTMGGVGMVRGLPCLRSCMILFTFTVKHNGLHLSASKTNFVSFLLNNNITIHEQISPRINGFLREAKLLSLAFSVFYFCFHFLLYAFFMSFPFLGFTFPCFAVLRYAMHCHAAARLCYAMVRYAIQCYALPLYAMQCYEAMLCCSLLCFP